MVKRPLGTQTIRVLGALGTGCRYGFDVVQKTGLISATVYRALRRLEKLDLVRSHWEDPGLAAADNRPRRRYYAVRPAGTQALESIRREYRAQLGEVSHDGPPLRVRAEEV